MATFSELQDIVASRITGSGINYNVNNHLVNLKRAINWSQQEFCAVQWQLLLKDMSFNTVAATEQYALFDTVGGVYDFSKESEVWYWPTEAGSRVKLTRCAVSDIETIGAAQAASIPQFFSIGGYIRETSTWNDDVRSIYIGMPTSDAAYAIKVYYYRNLPDLVNDVDESLISKAYNDNPIIEGAVWKFAQYMNIEIPPDLFYREMRVAQELLPYSGPTYPERLVAPGRTE
jgi:hypothetical protein